MIGGRIEEFFARAVEAARGSEVKNAGGVLAACADETRRPCSLFAGCVDLLAALAVGDEAWGKRRV
jgi:hypothetical protein